MSEIQLLAGEAQSKESSKAIQACNDYLRMGAGRSLAKLRQTYVKPTSKTTCPTASLRWLQEWSSKFDWVKRADEWDANEDARKTKEYEAAMKHGLALDYERVNSLKALAVFLEGQIYEQGVEGTYHNVWLPDIKAVDGVKYDIERFNTGILQQYRGTLDDLAKETGGRVAKQEISGADGAPLIPARAEKALKKVYGSE